MPPARHCNRCGMLWVKPKNKQKLEVLEILGEQMTPTHRPHPGLKRVEEWACAPPPQPVPVAGGSRLVPLAPAAPF